jgi:hypothetical protein
MPFTGKSNLKPPKNRMQQFRQLSSSTIFLLFTPLMVFICLCVAEDFFCVWSLVEDRYFAIWLSVLSVVVTAALIELNKKDTLKIVGSDPAFGTKLLAISFLSINVNGVLAAVFLFPYRFFTLLVGAPCAP